MTGYKGRHHDKEQKYDQRKYQKKMRFQADERIDKKERDSMRWGVPSE